MLPAPRSFQRENGPGSTAFADAVSYTGNAGVDMIKQIIGAFTSSLTTLGSRTNVLFTQVAAALAFDRMMRQTASMFGMGFAAFGMPQPQPPFAGGFWQAPAQPAMPFSPFSFFGLPLNPWMAAPPAAKPSTPNPMSAFTDMLSQWTNMWTSAASQSKPAPFASSSRPPHTTTISLPGCAVSVTIR
jgi:hypothetical protein